MQVQIEFIESLLQVRHASTGEFVPVIPVPNSILVIMGDLLEFWTSGYFKGTVSADCIFVE